MKKVSFFILLTLLVIANSHTKARIINGYEKQLKAAKLDVKNIDKVPHDNLNEQKYARYKEFVRETHEKIEKIEKLFMKTEMLIASLRLIDSQLYKEIDQIKDYAGNRTDVYVHALEDLGTNVKGFTNIGQKKSDPHVCISEHGDYSISVCIVFGSTKNCSEYLNYLVHELGHVLYIVPNLNSYVNYYKKAYLCSYIETDNFGHHDTDPGHLTVKATMRRFRSLWRKSSKHSKMLVRSGIHEIWPALTAK